MTRGAAMQLRASEATVYLVDIRESSDSETDVLDP